MRDRQQKKAQSKINKCVHLMNKNIEKDNLWRGRFYARQVDANWERFEDGSGGILTVWIEARDKKTGLYHGFALDNYNTSWCLWREMNEFIIEYSHVWDNINEVKEDKTNWSKTKWVPTKEIR